MDFELDDEQLELQRVVRDIAERECPPALVRAVVDGSDDGRGLWKTFVELDWPSLTVPADDGGMGMTAIELVITLEELGRVADPTAFLATTSQYVPIVRACADGERRTSLLGAVCAGTTGTVGFAADAVRARRDGDGWVLDGTRTNVPAGLVADTIVVPAATTGGGVALFLVPADAPGVDRARQDTTTGTPEALVTLDGVALGADAVLGPVDHAGTALAWLIEHATVAQCAVMAGVTAEAVRLTGEYTSARQQFGRPIATFQAVGQRAADAYVDAHAVRLTMLQAAWRLSAGKPAAREVAVAKYWAASGGQRVVHAASHLHGGVGVDRDYPLHRYFLLAKQLELSLGGASRQLVRLGGILAAEGARP